MIGQDNHIDETGSSMTGPNFGIYLMHKYVLGKYPKYISTLSLSILCDVLN